MTTISPDTVRRIEDAAAALIAVGNLNPTNEQVRQYLGGGSLSHISPVMRAFRTRRREQAEQTSPLPTELAQLLTSQLGLLWQAAVRQAGVDIMAAREQADRERDEALQLREPVARLTATGEQLTAQLQDTKAELKESREDGRKIHAELLALARHDEKVKK